LEAREARQFDAGDGKLTADVTGEVESEDGVLIIRWINVAMRLVALEGSRETVERTHSIYAMHCPLYRTLHKPSNSHPHSNSLRRRSVPKPETNEGRV
jgi:uncharacterized OsmC-like protein